MGVVSRVRSIKLWQSTISGGKESKKTWNTYTPNSSTSLRPRERPIRGFWRICPSSWATNFSLTRGSIFVAPCSVTIISRRSHESWQYYTTQWSPSSNPCSALQPSEAASTEVPDDRDMSPLAPEDGTETQSLGHSQRLIARDPLYTLSKMNLNDLLICKGTASSKWGVAQVWAQAL